MDCNRQNQQISGTLSNEMVKKNCVEDARNRNHSSVELNRLQELFNKINESDNFNGVAKNVRVQWATPTSALVELTLAEGHVNNKGTMHGGFTAAMTDIVTARVLGLSITDVPMVSVEIAVSYMNPAQIGDVITIEANCLKIGRSMAFTEAIFRRKHDGQLLAKGKHNIAYLNHLRTPGVQAVQF